MIKEECIKAIGIIEIIIEHNDDTKEIQNICNTVLRNAKNAATSALVNQIGTTFQFFVDTMIFGTNGTVGGVPKVIDDSRNGLFGTTLLTKSVAALVNPTVTNQAIFTTVVTFAEGNGNTINELALQMNNGDLYSMATLGGITKTSAMQVTFNWRITHI